MVIKLILSTGKEIELNEIELSELKTALLASPQQPVYIPMYPYYPIPWKYTWFCSSGTSNGLNNCNSTATIGGDGNP